MTHKTGGNRFRPMWELGCDGAFGCDCPTVRENREKRNTNLRGHGTRAKYVKGCRCITCRRANTKYQLEFLKKRKESGKAPDGAHGKVSTYSNYFCRCDECRAAKARYRRENENRNRKASA